MHRLHPMRQSRQRLTVAVAIALFVAPLAAACGEAAMVCDVAPTTDCDEMSMTGMAMDSQSHAGESAILECCEFDAEAVAALRGESSPTLEAHGRVATLSVPASPRPRRAAFSSPPMRSSSARYVLLESFLL